MCLRPGSRYPVTCEYSLHLLKGCTNTAIRFKIVIIFFRDIWEYWLGRSNILFAGLQKVYELTRSSGVEDSGPAGHGTHHERDEI